MQPFIRNQDGHEVHFSRNSPHKDNSYIYTCTLIYLYIIDRFKSEYESIHKDVN